MQQFKQSEPAGRFDKDGAFSWCDSLTSIDLPESVTSIGDEAFCYSGLEMIRMTKKQAKDFRNLIPDGVVIVRY